MFFLFFFFFAKKSFQPPMPRNIFRSFKPRLKLYAKFGFFKTLEHLVYMIKAIPYFIDTPRPYMTHPERNDPTGLIMARHVHPKVDVARN